MLILNVVLVLTLFGVCYGTRELHCNQKNCGESTNKYKVAQSIVEESLYMISPEDFYYKFVAKHRPIVMRKAASNWPVRKMWTEEYLLQSLSSGSQFSVANGINKFPFGSKPLHSIKEFFSRSQQEDLILFDKPTNQMLNDVTAPLCLRCRQFMEKMRVLYWLRQYKSKASTPLFCNPHEQILAVLNGSAQVTLVSSLYSEELPTDDNELLAIAGSNEEVLSKLLSENIPHYTVDLHEGDLLYIPQMWWQRVTLMDNHNLFVHFLWPSRIPRDDHIQFSSKAKDTQLSNIQESLRSLLRKYEERFLAMDIPSLVCPQQDMRMSSYTFETGKMSKEDYATIHDGPDFTESDFCNFDASNKENPCNFGSCLEDTESTKCIRYILDYCNQWEDRGCIIELPQVLNKVGKERMEHITTMKSPYNL